MATGVRDLIVIGAGLPGLAVAADGLRAGAQRVLVLGEAGRPILDPTIPVDVVRGTEILAVEDRGDVVEVTTSERSHLARVVVDARPIHGPAARTLAAVDDAVADRVHLGPRDIAADGRDILVIGDGDRAVGDVAELERAGAHVVFAFTGRVGDLARVSARMLARLEDRARITVLWRSVPGAIVDMAGEAMAEFDDRRMPDLVFDAVVEASDPPVAAGSGRVVNLGSPGFAPREAWGRLATEIDPSLPPPADEARIPARPPREIEALREEHYNATITSFDPAHSDLWTLRIRPDRPGTAHTAGQYATLGLGAWEPRADDAEEGSTRPRDRMIRRSYSISSRVLDEHGYLVDPRDEDEIELYIVHVRPADDRVPQLTPRLALKRAGDRIHLGPKTTGRYTLRPVTDPEADVVFLATGTGEAPHNAMVGDLLRRGHTGRIVSVVTVRYAADLAYEPLHRTLERRFPNYHYLTLPTREPGVPKRYIQDVVGDGTLAGLTEHGLAPDRTHVFMCGNPSMIGLPEWDGDAPTWPEPTGVCELLAARGFVLDRRGVDGNVHYEEYW